MLGSDARPSRAENTPNYGGRQKPARMGIFTLIIRRIPEGLAHRSRPHLSGGVRKSADMTVERVCEQKRIR